jgi:transcriptional regulator with XRE-family HTH domain
MKEKPDKTLQELGLLIKKLRIEKGFTAVEFGYRCEMDKTNINRIEKGNTNPTFLTLVRISLALEIDLKVLFEDFKITEDE